jgi:hypothetical protein
MIRTAPYRLYQPTHSNRGSTARFRSRQIRRLAIAATTAAALVGCAGGDSESPCVQSARDSLEFAKDLANDKWEDKQYEISNIGDRKLRLIQREASTEARNLAIAAAEEKFEAAKQECDVQAENRS